MKNVKARKKIRIGIVAAQFNDLITKRLVDGCVKELKSQGFSPKDMPLVWVPGSFEIPIAALEFAKKKNIDGVICLGAIVRGETIHFELVARAAQEGILEVALRTGKPVIFGIVAVDTLKQAYARSEDKGDNKGRDATISCFEMIKLLKEIKNA